MGCLDQAVRNGSLDGACVVGMEVLSDYDAFAIHTRRHDHLVVFGAQQVEAIELGEDDQRGGVGDQEHRGVRLQLSSRIQRMGR